ncbi:hypothetical protein CDAR_562081 [Caerostris darwini]|uniref:Uncharacterized protein n=1 Tax=Caerostris darwini TaxID=1538125 RepID=A0AAV4PE71_9ARAC|nr:hypothetical protein CDAR_562081 [Caerostris darwini]
MLCFLKYVFGNKPVNKENICKWDVLLSFFHNTAWLSLEYASSYIVDAGDDQWRWTCGQYGSRWQIKTYKEKLEENSFNPNPIAIIQ